MLCTRLMSSQIKNLDLPWAAQLKILPLLHPQSGHGNNSDKGDISGSCWVRHRWRLIKEKSHLGHAFCSLSFFESGMRWRDRREAAFWRLWASIDSCHRNAAKQTAPNTVHQESPCWLQFSSLTWARLLGFALCYGSWGLTVNVSSSLWCMLF